LLKVSSESGVFLLLKVKQEFTWPITWLILEKSNGHKSTELKLKIMHVTYWSFTTTDLHFRQVSGESC